MAKYSIGQMVFYLLDNKLHSAPILSIKEVKNDDSIHISTREQRQTFQIFGPSGVEYATTHGVIAEKFLFTSKADLFKKLGEEDA
jgi:hypothetical protein